MGPHYLFVAVHPPPSVVPADLVWVAQGHPQAVVAGVGVAPAEQERSHKVNLEKRMRFLFIRILFAPSTPLPKDHLYTIVREKEQRSCQKSTKKYFDTFTKKN